jgi:hypothetical protein
MPCARRASVTRLDRDIVLVSSTNALSSTPYAASDNIENTTAIGSNRRLPAISGITQIAQPTNPRASVVNQK